MSDEATSSAPVVAPASAAPGDSTQETVKADPTPAQVANLKKYKIKVDGNEEEVELDLNDEQTLVRHLQMSKAASKRMNEAAITKKQAEQFINALKTDPVRILTDPRIMGNEKFQAIAEEFLAKKLQEQMLSPEERKHIEMEERLRKYEESEKKAREEAEQKQIAQLEAHYAQQYQKTIIEALQSTSLPKNAFTVKRMAELMQKNIQHGLELEPQHLAQLVKEDYQRELVGLIGGSDADQIIAMFGEDVANKIRKHDLAKLKSKLGPQASGKESSRPKQDAGRKMRPDEYEAYLRGKL